MSWEIITLITFGMLIFLLFTGVPVAIALGLGAMITSYVFLGLTGAINYTYWSVTNTYVLTAVPLFIFMGQVLQHSGLAKAVYDGGTALVGKLPGGLLHSNIVACAIFAAMSGSSVATAATIGSVSFPELERRGYGVRISLGSLAAGGTLGIMIPPSIPLIIYGVLAEESIGALFIAGVLPGIMLATMFSIFILLRVIVQRHLAPAFEYMSLKDRFRKVIGMWPVVTVVLAIFGGIYGGVMTPTEAAAVGATMALAITLGYRRLNWSVLRKSLASALQTTSMLTFIVVGANMLSGVLGLLFVPSNMAIWVISMDVPRLVILLFIVVMYIFLGCFFEGISMMVLTLPIIIPIITSLGYDPVWFGICLVVLIEVAALTPPVGLNLFVIHLIARNYPLKDVILGSSPFVGIMVLGLVLLTAFPSIATWLPSTMR